MRWMLLLLVCAGLGGAYALGVFGPGGSSGAAPPAARAAPSGPGASSAHAKAGGAAASNLYYQYVDGANRVQFARSLDEVPPEWRERAGRVSLPVPPPAAPARRSAERKPPASPARRHAEGTFSAAGSSERAAQPEIEIYTLKTCGYCRAAMTYMDQHGLEYTNHDIEDEPEARDEYLEKTRGRAGVPVIDVEGQVLQGWDPRHFERVLASRSR